jgi:hypothetical protein
MGAGASAGGRVGGKRFHDLAGLGCTGESCACAKCAATRSAALLREIPSDQAYTLTTALRVIERSTSRVMPRLQESEARASARLRLQGVYQAHKPRKLGDIEGLLDEWAGRESLLAARVEGKYLRAEEPNGASKGGTAAVPIEANPLNSLRAELAQGTPKGDSTTPVRPPMPRNQIVVIESVSSDEDTAEDAFTRGYQEYTRPRGEGEQVTPSSCRLAGCSACFVVSCLRPHSQGSERHRSSHRPCSRGARRRNSCPPQPPRRSLAARRGPSRWKSTRTPRSRR